MWESLESKSGSEDLPFKSCEQFSSVTMLSLSRTCSGNSAQTTLDQLRQDKDFTDVTLVTSDDRQIEAHKVILGSYSSFFSNIFLQTLHQKPILYMHKVDPNRLLLLLEFLYKGEVKVEEDELEMFFELGKIFKIQGLEERDGFNIKVTKDEDIETTQKYDTFTIKETCSESIKDFKTLCLNEQSSLNKEIISCQNCDFQSGNDSDMQNHNTALHEDNETALLGFDSDDIPLLEIDKKYVDIEVKESNELTTMYLQSDATQMLEKASGKVGNIIPSKYICEWCEFRTSSKISMKDHRDCEHNGKFKCRKCNLPFLNFTTFVKHKYTKHSAGHCGKCDFEAKNRSQLKKHISTKHIDMSTSVSPQCPRCNIICASEASLKIHLSECEPVQCDLCKQKRYSGQMEAHRLARHHQNNGIYNNDTLDDMFPDL